MAFDGFSWFYSGFGGQELETIVKNQKNNQQA